MSNPSGAAVMATPVKIKIGGKTYTFSPLRGKQMGEFERWAQEREVQIGMAIADKLKGEDRDKAIRYCHDRVSRIRVGSNQMYELMATTEGIQQCARLMLQQHHPDITDDEVWEMVDNIESFEKMERAIAVANGLDDDDDKSVKKKAAKKKKRASRKRASR